jgi:hypothetical protein
MAPPVKDPAIEELEETWPVPACEHSQVPVPQVPVPQVPVPEVPSPKVPEQRVNHLTLHIGFRVRTPTSSSETKWSRPELL